MWHSMQIINAALDWSLFLRPTICEAWDVGKDRISRLDKCWRTHKSNLCYFPVSVVYCLHPCDTHVVRFLHHHMETMEVETSSVHLHIHTTEQMSSPRLAQCLCCWSKPVCLTKSHLSAMVEWRNCTRARISCTHNLGHNPQHGRKAFRFFSSWEQGESRKGNPKQML